eukprot:Partr_v1_DN28544_c2_g1_i2_m72635 putative ATP-binding cassette, sub-family G (WHITE), member
MKLLTFFRLRMKLTIAQMDIVKDISGKLLPGRLCAIMGPSGSGKTSFLSLLTGKVDRTAGSLFINGKPGELSSYRGSIGFVPQDDVMLCELTVWEILVHSASMRLPRDWSHDKITKKIRQVITYLGLTNIMDSRVGTVENRGISGGQRKRVNIAIELVANPSILFLDEPTSGLDSTTARDICTVLKTLTHINQMTCAAVIHSPSDAAFKQFDDLLLLGKGGKILYFGERDGALPYFDKCGFKCAANDNPADFLMDVALGKVSSNLSESLKPHLLPICWVRFLDGKEPVALTEQTRTKFTPGFKNLAKLVIDDSMELQRSLEQEAKNFNDSSQRSVGFTRRLYLLAQDKLDEFTSFWSDLFKRRTSNKDGRAPPSAITMFYLLTKRALRQILSSSDSFLFNLAM